MLSLNFGRPNLPVERHLLTIAGVVNEHTFATHRKLFQNLRNLFGPSFKQPSDTEADLEDAQVTAKQICQ